MAVVRKAWSRDELLVAFNLYCRIPFGRYHHGNPDVIKLVGVLGRHLEWLQDTGVYVSGFPLSRE